MAVVPAHVDPLRQLPLFQLVFGHVLADVKTAFSATLT